MPNAIDQTGELRYELKKIEMPSAELN